MDLMFQPLRKYAEFTGRARRSEYWLFFLLYLGILIVAGLFRIVLGAGLSSVLSAIIMLGLFVPSLALGFRRLHDIDRSAWWLLIGVVPIIGALVLLVFAVLPGTAGPNRFGQDPKALPSDTAAVFS